MAANIQHIGQVVGSFIGKLNGLITELKGPVLLFSGGDYQ
tara:strand:+ start:8487 stop:8606 length:120 start_codon:yes stop_codon:yes gene_type:complete